jgi:hypothetical protein
VKPALSSDVDGRLDDARSRRVTRFIRVLLVLGSPRHRCACRADAQPLSATAHRPGRARRRACQGGAARLPARRSDARPDRGRHGPVAQQERGPDRAALSRWTTTESRIGPDARPAPRRCGARCWRAPTHWHLALSRSLSQTRPYRAAPGHMRTSAMLTDSVFCSGFRSVRQCDTVASHARGRWFEPSRAHPGR